MAGTTAGDYQLGHDDAELERLNRQGRILAPATRTILEAVGLRPGMRVLYLGSGMGDLACAAAEFVGPAVEVGGVELSAETVVRANARAWACGLDRVAAIEFDALSVASLPSTLLVERVRGWIAEAFTRSGVLTSLGPRLWVLFQESGLPPLGMLAVQPMFGPHDDGAWATAAG